jgi:class 3 adenylate cyclase/tetratricopeptide (TPR) repeat protein
VPGGDLGALHAKLDRLTAQVEELTEAVRGLQGAPPQPLASSASPDDDVWRRLGLTEGERRTVTVVFADVTGFTALSETLDPEAMQLVMRDTMSLLAECVQAEGGTVEKFIGDALCAIFGAPVAHVDEPERAARACLAMHTRLAERTADRPDLPPLTVHVGINTGPVIAGAVGDGTQFGVMGDTINTAARLMGLAGDAQTYVSASTARRLRRWFRLEDAGLHEVKGKAEPIAVSSLLGELSEDEHDDQRRLHAPLIGRDEELATIRDLAARAREGSGSVVVAVGEAGAGLSRLAVAVAAELDAAGWRLLRGSTRIQAETPLGLVAAALRPLLEGATDPDVKAIAEALLGGGVAAPHDFELALGEVLVAASADAPLVITLDDVDAADPGSMEVVRYLARATARSPVLWLLTATRLPAAFAGSTGATDVVVLRVGPLSDDAVGELFEALLPGALGATQVARLVHLAEGNAQFAVEIAHALVDEGVVVEAEAGRWVLVGDADAVALPGSVAELVEARIDQLPTHARITLQDASVIGQRFSRRLLHRVATIPMSVDTALAELADAELVVPPQSGGVDPHDDLWSFRSRLAQQVAYDSILRRRRPPAHRAVAEALLDLEPERVEENADLLAHHLEEGDDPPSAIPHLIEAIDRAEFAYNFTGALERAKRALRLRDRFPGRVTDRDAAWLLQRVGIVRLVLGDDAGLVDLQHAVDLLEEVGTPVEVASLHERVGWYLTVSGEQARAVPHLEAARALADATLTGPPKQAALAAVATSRAFAVAAGGDLRAGLAAAEAAEADAREAGDQFTEARALLVGGVCHLWAGVPGLAIDRLRASLDISWTHHFGTLADRCGRWLVLGLVDAGRFDEAIELADPLMARSDDRGDPSVGCGVRAALAHLWRQAGDRDRARQLATEAAAVAEERHVAADAAAEAHLLLAHLALDSLADRSALPVGATELALAEAAAQLRLLAHATDEEAWLSWRWSARAALVRGRMAVITGDGEAALAAARDVRDGLAGTEARRELLAAARIEGEVLAGRGDPAAVALLTGALDEAESLGSPHLVSTTAAIVARSLRDLAPDVASAARRIATASREPLRAYAPRGTVPAS